MSRAQKRSAARLASVQALYQMDIRGTNVVEVLAEFENHWIGQEIDGVEYSPAEESFFRDIVGGVVREQRSIDPKVDQALADGWPLKRVDAILRAILRAGVYELLHRKDIPPKVTISEYVSVAHAFLDREESGMVNAVLDKIAKAERSDHLQAS
ncbi:transcription antitermination factor NusB [Labrys sp. LIt4]|uniref:Transcription antitermination protein NusB n=1 Tax=Labrys okinawensis TaxID=346911 RepID=A0A2S9QCK1_9HYPH|nr:MULTISPECIES: transcription antitermination factor NusB [Labrys]MBP0579197.1 transcription antitermination factor NusB [Labrys sp. LIt4]PRH87076.1 transcription antitermination factor NusB [Labrys okinawensis]